MALAKKYLTEQYWVVPSEKRPLIGIYDSQQLEQKCSADIATIKAQVEQFATQPLSGNASTNTAARTQTRRILTQWDAIASTIQDAYASPATLGSLSPDGKVRDVAEKCELQLGSLGTDMSQDPRNYAQFKRLSTDDPVDRKVLEDTRRDFVNSGIDLPPDQRAALKALIDRNTGLAQTFERNVRESPTVLTFTEAQMQGLPTSYLQQLKRDGSGNYLLNMDYTAYFPFMQLATDDDARKQYYIAFSRRGSAENLAVLNELVANRLKMARMLGYDSYAALVLADNRMARTPATVNAFLQQIQTVVGDREQKELAELKQFRASEEKRPLAEVSIDRWNESYWSTRRKKALFKVDAEQQRAYFPPAAATAWILSMASQMYDIGFSPVVVPVWHDSVQYYDIVDNRTHQRIAGIYFDLFPRDGKFKHAAASNVRGASTLTGRTPISVLMTNLDPKGLTQSELVTLVHEFGHGLHGTLSRTRYASKSGTAVERDFVEAPSQMFEEWGRRYVTLSQVADFCQPACPRVDEAMVRSIRDAKRLTQGGLYANQVAYAMYDMSLHSASPADVMAGWIAISSKTPLGYVPDTQFPGTFGHIAGGYAAGYYGYLWSEALARDMQTPFLPAMVNAEAGARYRDTVLMEWTPSFKTASDVPD